MPRSVIIEFSLVIESNEKTDNEIITEISKALSTDELLIPWCDKNLAIRIDYNKT